MTYSLPFELKQKPMNHYVTGGIIKFAVREGKLFYTIKAITKTSNGTIRKGEVKTKFQLETLLSSKTLDVIQTIEVVA